MSRILLAMTDLLCRVIVVLFLIAIVGLILRLIAWVYSGVYYAPPLL